jgi:hypothetical protein
MSDDEFFAFLNACRRELGALQSQFQERIEEGRPWSYDLADGTLRIGDESFPIVPIGTYSAEYNSWLWAWANEDFPLSSRETSKHLQSLHTLTGFQVFLDRGIGASASDAQDFAALAVHCLGAIGFFRVPGTPILYLAVHESDSNCRNA